MTFVIKAIRADDVPQIWPRVENFFVQAVERSQGRYDMESLYGALLTEWHTLWILRDLEMTIHASFVTRIAIYPKKRMLSVDFLGGHDMAEWLQMLTETLDKVSLELGCDGIEAFGRKGWGRALERFGWTTSAVLFEKTGAS